MRKILITGANGFIGKNCYNFFVKDNDVYTIDLKGSQFKKCIIGNVTADNVNRINQKFDLIIHLAGSGTVSSATEHPETEKSKSVDSLIEILNYIKNYNSNAKLIFASSASVYGNSYQDKIKEDFSLCPFSKYGSYKLECEGVCKKYAEQFNLDIKVIRFFSLYGRDNKKQLLYDVLNRINSSKTKKLLCYGTGEEKRDFINISDAVNFIDIISRRQKGFEVFNCGSGVPYTVRDITKLLLKFSHKSLKQTYDNIKREGNPDCLIADISKSKNIGFSPKINLNEGVFEYVKWVNGIYKIFFPIYMNENWLGGVNYYKNLFQAISLLPNSPIEICLPKQNPEILFEYATPFDFTEKNIKDLRYRIAKLSHFILHRKFNKKEYFESRMLQRFDLISHSSNFGFSNIPVISWIPDFQHLYLQNFFSKEEIKMRDDFYLQCAKKSRVVILSSECARCDFVKLFPEYSSKARVLRFVSYIDYKIYDNTEENKKEIIFKYNLPDRFFYIPNQFWQHKNHLTVFKAVSLLKRKGVNVNVVCSGNTGDYRKQNFFNEVVLKFIKDNNLEDNIKILGIIDLNDVYQLMRNCVSVINPSLFEGWSSTVEEVKSLGKNIILSDLDVHKEQNPPNAIFFKRLDYEELASIMEENWINLPGGPDYELEKIAQDSLKGRMIQFGTDYYNIVKDIIGNK